MSTASGDYGNPSLSPEAGGSDSQGKSPLSSLGLDIFKSIGGKKTTRDGNTPKRRGPKPDSKPALTRRQELNRQAQRTHRERKELYIKALEDEVLRLKELYSKASQEKDRVALENQQLKQTLSQYGIPVPATGNGDDFSDSPSGGNGPGSTTSGQGGGNNFLSFPAATPAGASHSTGVTSSPSNYGGGEYQRSATGTEVGNNVGDVEQAGIDFVLTLEKPCMDHLAFVLELQSEAGPMPCGHAMMASCPPRPFSAALPDQPFGHRHDRNHSHGESAPNTAVVEHQQQQQQQQQQATWMTDKNSLCNLLDLSSKLDLEGEITPIMAWGMIMAHPHFHALTAADLRLISEILFQRVRCYGFGAVMEEFEVRDAINGVLSLQMEGMVH